MEKDGTYAAIYKRWFGDEVSPYPLGRRLRRSPRRHPPTRRPRRRRTRPSRLGGRDVCDVRGAARRHPEQDRQQVLWERVGSSWQRIYEANRDVIGDDPGRLKVGAEPRIPQ